MKALIAFLEYAATIAFMVMVVWVIVDKVKKHKVPKKHWIWFIASIVTMFIMVGVSNATGVDIGDDSSQNSSSSSSSQSSSSSSSAKSSSSSSSSSSNSSEKKESSSSSSSSSSSQKVTMEDQNALDSAKEYVSEQFMSQKGLYQQLTSSDGDGFKPEAAQYAIDQLNNKYHIDWDKVALKNAENYQSEEHMSRNDIYQQLISSDGEQFTVSQAQYAIAHLPQ